MFLAGRGLLFPVSRLLRDFPIPLVSAGFPSLFIPNKSNTVPIKPPGERGSSVSVPYSLLSVAVEERVSETETGWRRKSLLGLKLPSGTSGLLTILGRVGA